MKRTKKFLSLLVVLAVLCVVVALASCDVVINQNDPTQSSQDTGNSTGAIAGSSSNGTTENSTTGSSTVDGGTTSDTTIESDVTSDTTIDSDVTSDTTIDSDVTSDTTIDSDVTSDTTIDSNVTSDTTIDSDVTSDTTIDSDPSSGDDTPDTSGKLVYTIQIVDKNTGKPISNVSVFIQDEASYEGIIYARGKTDENGIVELKADPKNAKCVYVEGIPNGYAYEEFYTLGETGVKIEVATSIIENEENDFSDVTLQLGDVMYDFDLTAYVYDKETGEITTKNVKLSDLFANGKKAVMLNFWYTTCTYCIEEFPYIQSAYEAYGDDIEVIGINAYPADSDKDVMKFMEDFAKPGFYTDEGCALTFPMVMDTAGIQDAFGFTVNPCSVIVDRYGVVSMVQIGGVLGERYFTNAFKHYVEDNYEQELYSSIYDLSPLAKPDIEMSPVEDMKDAAVVGDINISFRPETDGDDAEYAWPFVVYEKDGEMCLASTNVDLDNSFSILYVDVELKAGEAIMFDYFASTQRIYDVLYVLIDGKDIYTISGRPLEDENGNLLQDPWQGCCPWVATEDGTYELAFCYIKDESEKDGDDRVYLDNFRIVNAEDIDVESHIPRYAATNQNGLSFENYVEIVFNEEDGYYHVGTVDGPILLAGLMDYNTQFSKLFAEGAFVSITNTLVEEGEFLISGKDVYKAFIMYCNYASNSRLYGYCPVTPELKGYLDAFAREYSPAYSENSWLQLCSYYETYGTDVPLEDPIKGLTTFSAYDAIVTPEGEEGFRNTVTYTQIVMPRGYLYKFVPTKSGVYRITSNSSQEVNGWVFVGSFEQWVNENNGDRVLYIDSTTGERYCPELLVDSNGDGIYERDFTNCTMIGYFEEGVEYYIDIAYYDVYAAGTFTFDLKYVGESFDVFEEASQGVFSFDELTEEIIATGIDVALCTDESDPRFGYYCQLLPNGELGSIIYADFHFTTNIFGTQSLEMLIDQGAFDMRMTEMDREAYAYYKNYYLEGGKNALRQLWGDNFDANWEMYQMDDVVNGIYHGTGPDYTEAVRAYLDKLEDGTDGGEEIVYPERQGCVAVDSELAVMLQALMDKFTFEGVEHSWTKLCYYYKKLEAPKSVEEMFNELEAMVANAEITDGVIESEIYSILTSTNEALKNWSIDIVKRNIINGAMSSIFEYIELDKSLQ